MQVTATDLELMLSSCGGQTVAASSIRDRHAKDAHRTRQHAPYACPEQRQPRLDHMWQTRIDLNHHQSCQTTTCQHERGGQKHVVIGVTQPPPKNGCRRAVGGKGISAARAPAALLGRGSHCYGTCRPPRCMCHKDGNAWAARARGGELRRINGARTALGASGQTIFM